MALIPQDIGPLGELGLEILVEEGAGAAAGFPDALYREAGAKLVKPGAALGNADLVCGLEPPPADVAAATAKGATYLGMLDVLRQPELVRDLAGAGMDIVSLTMVPRITRAQKMDALSSQANLAGYVAVLQAADRLPRVLPMMMTAAGTLQPARVLVVGVGVAGLQAIATARRLGARVEAFDTRPVVEEQVRSLGARFVKVDLGETGETAGGYARELTEEQLAMQRQALSDVCARSEIVVTAAQVFGRKAPVIVTSDMLDRMMPGAVVVDAAIDTGGNVEESRRDEIYDRKGVTIMAMTNLPSEVAGHASQVYSANLRALLEELWDAEAKGFHQPEGNEVAESCVIVRDGKIRSEQARTAVEALPAQKPAAAPKSPAAKSGNAGAARPSAEKAKAAAPKPGSAAKAGKADMAKKSSDGGDA